MPKQSATGGKPTASKALRTQLNVAVPRNVYQSAKTAALYQAITLAKFVERALIVAVMTAPTSEEKTP